MILRLWETKFTGLIKQRLIVLSFILSIRFGGNQSLLITWGGMQGFKTLQHFLRIQQRMFTANITVVVTEIGDSYILLLWEATLSQANDDWIESKQMANVHQNKWLQYLSEHGLEWLPSMIGPAVMQPPHAVSNLGKGAADDARLTAENSAGTLLPPCGRLVVLPPSASISGESLKRSRGSPCFQQLDTRCSVAAVTSCLRRIIVSLNSNHISCIFFIQKIFSYSFFFVNFKDFNFKLNFIYLNNWIHLYIFPHQWHGRTRGHVLLRWLYEWLHFMSFGICSQSCI